MSGSVMASEIMPMVTAAAVSVPRETEYLIVEKERQRIEYPVSRGLPCSADAKSQFGWHSKS